VNQMDNLRLRCGVFHVVCSKSAARSGKCLT